MNKLKLSTLKTAAAMAARQPRLFLGITLLDLLSRLPLLVIPLLWKWMLDTVLGLHHPDDLTTAAILYAVSGLSLLIFGGSSALLISLAAERAAHSLRERLVDHLNLASPRGAIGEEHGRQIALFTEELPAVEGLLGATLPCMAAAILSILLMVALIAYVSPQFLLLCMSFLPVLCFVAWMANRWLSRLANEVQAARSDVLVTVADMVEGRSELIAAGGLRERFGKYFRRAWSRRYTAIRRQTIYGAIINGTSHFIFCFASVVVFYFALRMVSQGTMTIGTAVAISELFIALGYTGKVLLNHNYGLVSGLTSLQRLGPYIQHSNSFEEAEMPQAPGFAELSVKEVSFVYPGGSPLIRDISFVLPQRHIMAIYGPSGIGKSTLARLLCADLTPAQGRIFVNEADISSLSRHQVSQLISIKYQNPHIFAMTIRENLQLASSDPSDAEILRALRRACLNELPLQPNVLDMQMGPAGERLSIGQRQRLALARLYLSNSPIWILDEPTSALDREIEANVLDGLSAESRHRSILILTHSEAVLQIADSVYELREGQLVEQIGNALEDLTVHETTTA